MKFKAVVKDYLYESFIHCMANLFSICMMNTYTEIQSHTLILIFVCVCVDTYTFVRTLPSIVLAIQKYSNFEMVFDKMTSKRMKII